MDRRGRALLLLAALSPLAACGADPEPLPAAGAVSHYEDFVDELAGALADGDTSWQHAPATQKVTEQKGGCRFTPGTWQPDAPLPAPEVEDDWEERIAQVNPVLTEHGFSEIEHATEQGSRSVLESRDAHGASLEITPEGRIRLWEVAVEADPCSPETLGIG